MLDHKIPARDLNEWLEHPTTKEVFHALRMFRAENVRSLESGDTLAGDLSRMVSETARAVGTIYGIDLLLEIETREYLNSIR